MDATHWGPKLWFVLHTVSFEYPDIPTQEDKNNHYTFFETLQHILPCKICKKHYATFFENSPITDALESKEKLIRWVLKCHNNVNKQNNKPEWTYDMLVDKYANIYKNSLYNHISYKNLSIVLATILILLIIYLYLIK